MATSVRRLSMINSIWRNPSPIGRLQYFKDSILIAGFVFLVLIPSTIMETYEKRGDPFSSSSQIIVLFISLIGVVLSTVLSFKLIFKRARDLEGKNDVNRLKWICLTIVPILSIYGHIILLFKKGKL
jgi:uncharacterized membrane protein YhaH (DUF805 family)